MVPFPQLDFKRMPVTLILMAVIVAIELICTFDDSQRDYYYSDLKLGMLSLIWEGELWRPFTTTLLHGGPIHAFFNVYWLALFGGTLEPRLGSYRFLGIVVLLAYASILPEFLWTNFDAPVDAQRGIVGFSGVNYGLFGMLWIGRRWRREFAEVCTDATVMLLGGWFFLCIVVTHAGYMDVANIAHGAGCAFGTLYSLALFRPRDRAPLVALATVVTALVLATLVGFPRHAGYEHIKHRRELRREFERMLEPKPPTQPEDE